MSVAAMKAKEKKLVYVVVKIYPKDEYLPRLIFATDIEEEAWKFVIEENDKIVFSSEPFYEVKQVEWKGGD